MNGGNNDRGHVVDGSTTVEYVLPGSKLITGELDFCFQSVCCTCSANVCPSLDWLSVEFRIRRCVPCTSGLESYNLVSNNGAKNLVFL